MLPSISAGLREAPSRTIALRIVCCILCIIPQRVPGSGGRVTLEPVVENWSIVVAGSWNRVIFSPQWVAANLAETGNVMLEVAFNDPTKPPRFTFDEVRLSVSPTRLSLFPTNVNDAVLERTSAAAVKVLGVLHHTPVTAVGVNFAFRERQPSARQLDVFRFSDDGRISEQGVRRELASLRRRLVFDDGVVLNLTLQHPVNGDHLTADFNFHWAADTAEAAKQALDGGIVALSHKAEQFVEDLYGE